MKRQITEDEELKRVRRIEKGEATKRWNESREWKRITTYRFDSPLQPFNDQVISELKLKSPQPFSFWPARIKLCTIQELRESVSAYFRRERVIPKLQRRSLGLSNRQTLQKIKEWRNRGGSHRRGEIRHRGKKMKGSRRQAKMKTRARWSGWISGNEELTQQV